MRIDARRRAPHPLTTTSYARARDAAGIAFQTRGPPRAATVNGWFIGEPGARLLVAAEERELGHPAERVLETRPPGRLARPRPRQRREGGERRSLIGPRRSAAGPPRRSRGAENPLASSASPSAFFAGDEISPAERLTQTSPAAPCASARSASSSSLFRESAAPPGTRRPRTVPPLVSALSNGTNPDPAPRSRGPTAAGRSGGPAGRSRRASHRLARTSAAETARSRRCPPRRRPRRAPPPPCRSTSSSVGKDISMSICVNSGCRSARRSSSRKQRAIWKYLSNPRP